MARKNKRPFGGTAAPGIGREPLFVRLCAAFVDNLTMLLRIGYVVGTVFLIQQLDGLIGTPDHPKISSEQVAEELPVKPVEGPETDEPPLITDGVRLAYECTFKEFRTAHPDECAIDSVDRQAEPDDTGLIFRVDSPVLYARTGKKAGQRPANET